jgi:hypothetical protein
MEIIGSLASGAWVAAALVVISLCRAAKRGDYAMDTALARELAEGPDAEIRRSPPTGVAPWRSTVAPDSCARAGQAPASFCSSSKASASSSASQACSHVRQTCSQMAQ